MTHDPSSSFPQVPSSRDASGVAWVERPDISVDPDAVRAGNGQRLPGCAGLGWNAAPSVRVHDQGVPVSPTKQRKPTAAEKAKAEADKRSVVARNKKASHDYHIDETIEAGLALTGTEVKSLRMGRASLVDGWVEIDRGEAWLQGVHIPEYSQGTWTNHAVRRKRKLLLHRDEIDKLASKSREKGHTVVPLELYFIRGRAKVLIALARGKKEYDKRHALREKQDVREAQRAMSLRVNR
ncbi:SsrA-binding protein SmpB [Georgenia sp. 311]|uniref:SsrA-binding protein n=1 Tax=Georgenia wutianyii TaxID=2585135 RepID=A0ABX5VL73_9MICO|nr:SsrA-binding protein SmpB [Georgenia wutianyii]TNC16823.1 SsrA-binding protein SmpB [Georgenia sp. 311]